MSDARALYHAVIVRHDREPANEGPLPEATHRATVDNPLCGDVATIHLALGEAGVARATFEARGCALARASAAMAAARASGSTAGELRRFAAAVEAFVHAAPDAPIPAGLGEVEAFAAVRRFKSRRACACLGFRALVEALP